MLDRLKDIQNNKTNQSLNTSSNQNESQLLIESNLEEFLKKKNEILYKFEKIEEYLIELTTYLKKIKTTTDEKSEKSITNKFDSIYQNLKRNFKQIDSDIKNLENITSYDSPNLEDKDKKVMESNISSLYKTYEKKLKETQRIFFEFRNLKKKKLARIVKIADVDNKYDDEQLEEMTENPELVYKIISDGLKVKPSLKMQYRAYDITEKCESIKKLQKNIKELVEMIKEISKIVYIQGEKIDTIANHVGQAKDYVEKGNKNLTQAKKYHQEARTKMCIIIVLAVVILAIILMVALI